MSTEYKLAYYCAPTLMGIKPASLISLKKGTYRETRNYLKTSSCIVGQLFNRNIKCIVLRSSHENDLILVYQPELLQETCCNNERNKLYLQNNGYHSTDRLNDLLRILRQRFLQSDDFPHEIGLFLGYPLEDVIGFTKEAGKNYKLCGYWKVYGNPEKAQKLFNLYNDCRENLCSQLSGGIVSDYKGIMLNNLITA